MMPLPPSVPAPENDLGTTEPLPAGAPAEPLAWKRAPGGAAAEDLPPGAEEVPPPAGAEDLPPGAEPAPAMSGPATPGVLAPEVAEQRAQFDRGHGRLAALARAGFSANPTDYLSTSPSRPGEPPSEIEAYEAMQQARMSHGEDAGEAERAGAFLRWQAKNSDLTADQAVEIEKVAAVTGHPLDYVRQNLEPLRKEVEAAKVDWEGFAREHPALARFALANPENFAQVKDETVGMSRLEYALTGKLEDIPTDVYKAQHPDEANVDVFGHGSVKVWNPPVWLAAFNNALRHELRTKPAEALYQLSSPNQAPRNEEELDALKGQLAASDVPIDLTPDEENAIRQTWADRDQMRLLGQSPGIARPPTGEEQKRFAALDPAPDAPWRAALKEKIEGWRKDENRDFGPWSRSFLGKVVLGGVEMGPMLLGNVAAAAGGTAAAGPGGGAAAVLAYNTATGFPDLAYEIGEQTDAQGNKIGGRANAPAAAAALAGGALMTVGVGAPLKKIIGETTAKTVAEMLTRDTLAASLKRAAKEGPKEVLAGVVTMMAQGGINKGVEVGTTGKGTAEDVANAITDSMAQALPVMLGLAGVAGARSVFAEAGARARAKDSTRTIEALNDVAKASKFFKVSPEKAAELVKTIRAQLGVGDEGVTHLHVDLVAWDRLFQGEKVDAREMAAQVMGDGGKAYDEAKATKQPRLAVPIEQYLTKLAPAEGGKFAAALAPDAALAPEARTTNDQIARDTALSKRAKELSSVKPEEMPEGQRRVLDDFEAQAVAAGVDPKSAHESAVLHASTLQAMAEQAGRGESAWDMWQIHPTNIRSPLADQGARAHLAGALADYDLSPAGQAWQYVRTGKPGAGLEALHAARVEEHAASGRAVLPKAQTAKLDALRAELAGVEGGAGKGALERPSPIQRVPVKVSADEEGGARVDLTPEGATHAAEIPSWLKPEEFTAARPAWEWTWSALEGGPAAPEALQRAVHEFMKRGTEGFPPDEFALKQGFALGRLAAGKGGKKFKVLRERLADWAEQPEATRGPPPIPEQAWGALIDTARKDVGLESTSRGFLNRTKTEVMDRWLSATRGELDPSRPGYAERPPEFYRKPGEEPAPAHDAVRAEELRAEIAKVEAEAKEKATVKAPKIDFDEAARILGKDVKGIPTEKGGVKPDDLARAVGAKSGDELLRSMVERKDRAKWARTEAARRRAAGEAAPRRVSEAPGRDHLAAEFSRRAADVVGRHELAREELVDTNTGLPNEKALALSEHKGPWAVLGVQGVALLNDKLSHPDGDKLIRSHARAVVEVAKGREVYKAGQDFLVAMQPGEKAKDLADAVNERAAEPGFTVEPAEGSTPAEARANLQAWKDQAEKSAPGRPAERAKRGERPFGATYKDLADLDFGEETPQVALPERAAAQHAEGLSDPVATFRRMYLDRDDREVLNGGGWAKVRTEKPKAHVLSFDAAGIGFRDRVLWKELGLEATPEFADATVRVITQIMAAEGGAEFDAAHPHGDEYAAQHDNQAKLEDFARRVETRLKTAKVRVYSEGTGPRGADEVIEILGIGASHGTGETEKIAETKLNAAKEEAAKNGERNRKGEEPAVERARVSRRPATEDERARHFGGGAGGLDAGDVAGGDQGQGAEGGPRVAAQRLEQAAFHGTHARQVGRFSLQHVGTGEGSQAFHWGLYFAERKGIAEGYRKSLAQRTVEWNGKPVDFKSDIDVRTATRIAHLVSEEGIPVADAWAKVQRDILREVGEEQELISGLGTDVERMREDARAAGFDPEKDADVIRAQQEADAASGRVDKLKAQVDFLEKNDPAKLKVVQGQTYEVDLPEKHELLDYDKPIREQEPAVLDKLRASGVLPSEEEMARFRALGPLDRLDPKVLTAENVIGALEGNLEGGGGGRGAKRSLPEAIEEIRRFTLKQRKEQEASIEEHATKPVPGWGTMGEAVAESLRKDLKRYDTMLAFLDEVEKDPARLDEYRDRIALTEKYGALLEHDKNKLDGHDLMSLLEKEHGSPKGASERMRAAGVPGLKFLDQPSRGMKARERWVVKYSNDTEKPAGAGFGWNTEDYPTEAAAQKRVAELHADLAVEGFGKAWRHVEVEHKPSTQTHNFVLWDEDRIALKGRLYQAAKRDRLDAFRGMSREEFLGNPPVVKMADAAELKPRDIRAEYPKTEPFMEGKYRAKFAINGSAVFDGDKVIASYNHGETLAVDKKYRKQGIAEELVYQYRTRFPGPARAGSRNKVSQHIQEKVWGRIQSELAPRRLKQESTAFLGGGDGFKSTAHFSQARDGEPRGFIEFTPNAQPGQPIRLDINILKGDRSTLAHESFHALSLIMGQVATREDAPAALRQQYQKLLDVMGYADDAERRAKPDAAKEEKASHLFEAYLLEGKAPTPELLSTFARFKSWLGRLYGSIKGISDTYEKRYGQKLEMSDDVRDLFARMVAGDKAVDEAAKEHGAEMPEVKLTPEEQQQADDLRAQGRAAAEAAVQRQLSSEERSADKEFMRSEMAKVRAQAEQDLQGDRVFAAQTALEKGEVGGMPVKLDPEAIRAAYGAEVANLVPKEMTKKGGITPDMAAQVLGFGDGRELVRALTVAPSREQALKAETKRRMGELYPRLQDRPALLAETARKVDDNDALLREGLLRMRAMAREAGLEPPQVSSAEDVKRAAEDAIQAKPLGEQSAAAYDSAAKSYARKMADTKDPQKRLDALEAYLMNHALAKASRAAAEKAERQHAALERWAADKRRADLGRASEAHKEGVDAILSSSGIATTREGALPAPEALQNLLLQLVNDGNATVYVPRDETGKQTGPAVILPDAIDQADVETLQTLTRQPKEWKDLTPAEASTVHDAVKSIRHQALEQNQITMDGKRLDREMVIDQMVEALHANLKEQPKITDDPLLSDGLVRSMRNGVQAIDALEQDIATLAHMMDGGNRDGVFHKVLIDRRLKARDERNALTRTVLRDIVEKFEKSGIDRARLTEALDVSQDLPLDTGLARFRKGEKRTRSNLIMMLLNLGNASNEERFLGGHKWTREQVMKVMEKHLNANEARWVQGVWDTLESLYPEMAKAHAEETGLPPEKIKAKPFTFHAADGDVEMAGGYFPARYDPRPGSERRTGERQVAKEVADFFSGNYTRSPTVASPHAKQRARHFEDVVNLNWGIVPAHIGQVIHDITFRKFVKETAALLLNDRLNNELVARLGEARAKTLQPWLKAVANARADSLPDHLQWTEQSMAVLKSAAAKAALGWSIPRAISDVVSDPAIAVAAGYVSPLYMARASAKTLNPVNFKSARAFVLEKSGELRDRQENLRQQMNRALGKMGGRQVMLNPTLRALRDSAFVTMELGDHLITTPMWHARYEQSLVEYGKAGKGGAKADKLAVRDADDMIRKVMPPHDIADKPAIIRDHQVLGSLLLFHGHANKIGGIYRRRLNDIVRGFDTGGFSQAVSPAAKFTGTLLAMTIANGILAEWAAGRGKTDNETSEQWVERKSISALFYPVPIVNGPLEALVSKGITGEVKPVSIRGAPGFDFAMRAVKGLGEHIHQWMDGDVDAGHAAQDAAQVMLGYAAGAPTRQANETTDYLRKLATGETVPRGPGDVLGGFVYGEDDKGSSNPFVDAQSLYEKLTGR